MRGPSSELKHDDKELAKLDATYIWNLRNLDRRKFVSSEEVIRLLRSIGRGEVTPHLKDPERSWKSVKGSGGVVSYLVDGWELNVFYDVGGWDYVDSAISPGGRVGDYDDWNPENEHFFREGSCPSHRLGEEDSDLCDAMINRLGNLT